MPGCRVQQSVSACATRAQPYTLSLQQLRVTTAESFWDAVELTADRSLHIMLQKVLLHDWEAPYSRSEPVANPSALLAPCSL